MKLQRILTDFGADISFAKAVQKAHEHYGVNVPISGVRNQTLKHANAIQKRQTVEINKIKEVYSPRHSYKLKTGAELIITETDGSMVPIIKINSKVKDKRKKKERVYQEARLCLSYENGSTTPIYAATMGDVGTTGKYMRLTAEKAGLGKNSDIHAVGDGAQWIVNQLKEKFGDVGEVNYLIDLYHMSEYLSDASTEVVTDEISQAKWTQKQIKLLKDNASMKVLENLKQYKDHPEDSPAMQCYRYINNRPNQFEYKTAIDKDLPIGSGRVEGGHRHIIQARLKISGAAWITDNANSMLALRTNRANNEWDGYWKQIKNHHI